MMSENNNQNQNLNMLITHMNKSFYTRQRTQLEVRVTGMKSV